MTNLRRLGRATPALILSLLLGACGGGETTTADPLAADGLKQALKGSSCSGSCSGGGGTPVPGATNPLPTTAPSPDIIYRESFGPGPEGLRPKSGKGDLRSTFIGTTLGGYWIEWPGSKDNGWITPAGEATWKFTSSVSVNDPVGNPHELPSPLETNGYRGQVGADITDGASSGYPAALVRVALSATPWAVSMEGYPQNVPGAYLALGLSDSSATLNNLLTTGKVSLVLRYIPGDAYSRLSWELWLGGATRRLLFTGITDDWTYNRLMLAYDPQTQVLSASVNGVAIGSFSANLGAPRYAGFEGTGMADDFVIRKLPALSQ